MLKHNEFVVITLDKETNQLLSFLCGRMRKKENNLIKRAMFKQGTSILEHIIRDATKYVQLWDNYEEEEG